MQKLSKNLISFRNKKKLSKEELAVKANLSYHAINSLENGTRVNPNMTTLIKLADALEVSLDDLVGRKG